MTPTMVVGLGELRQLTGGIGDNFDEHVAREHGIDYGTHVRRLQNGARGKYKPQNGDILTIQIPDGRQFTFYMELQLMMESKPNWTDADPPESVTH